MDLLSLVDYNAETDSMKLRVLGKMSAELEIALSIPVSAELKTALSISMRRVFPNERRNGRKYSDARALKE